MTGEIRVVGEGGLPTRQTSGQEIDRTLPAGSRIQMVKSANLGWKRFKVLKDNNPEPHWYTGTREALFDMIEERTMLVEEE